MEMRPGKHYDPTNVQAMRGSVLGQMHGGEVQTYISHPFQHFFCKASVGVNITGFLCLLVMFRVKDMFPPHDAPLMSAVGWYFVFGAMYGLFALLFLKFAIHTKKSAVAQSLTQNRRYEWHSRYDTSKMTEEDLKKIPEAQRVSQEPAQAVSPGANYFRISILLIAAALVSFGIGLNATLNDLL